MEKTGAWLFASLPTILIILVLAILTMKMLDPLTLRLQNVFLGRLQKREDETGEVEKRIMTLAQIIKSAMKLVIGFMVALLLLREVGVDIAPLIAGAGIAGLAVGFGAQNLVRDFISGFFILLEDQVRVGDVAVVNGTGGLVESVGLRTMVLRDQSGVVHIFPNGAITMVSNMTKDWSAMVFDISVAYKENVDHVIEVMKEVGAKLQTDPEIGTFILEPLEVMGLDAFADSALVIKSRFKTKPRQQWVVGREFNKRLKKAFDEAGIEIPFPQRTIQLISSDKEVT